MAVLDAMPMFELPNEQNVHPRSFYSREQFHVMGRSVESHQPGVGNLHKRATVVADKYADLRTCP